MAGEMPHEVTQGVIGVGRVDLLVRLANSDKVSGRVRSWIRDILNADADNLRLLNGEFERLSM
jgi:uncharacterized protein (DUF2336 family)